MRFFPDERWVQVRAMVWCRLILMFLPLISVLGDEQNVVAILVIAQIA